MRNKKGFTLTEIIATLVIIGVLLLIAIPTYSHFTKKFEKEYYVNKEKTFLASAKTYFQDHKIDLPADDLYTYYVTLDELASQKYIENNSLKAYRGNDKISGYAVSIKTPDEYVDAICFKVGEDSYGYSSSTDKNGEKSFDGGYVNTLCDSAWKNNDEISNSFGNGIVNKPTDANNNSVVYVYYDDDINYALLKKQLGVSKTLLKYSKDGENSSKLIGSISDDNCEEVFYPENLTSFNLNNKFENMNYNFTYKDGNDLFNVNAFLYTHKSGVSSELLDGSTLYLETDKDNKKIGSISIEEDDSYNYINDAASGSIYTYYYSMDDNCSNWKKLECINSNEKTCKFDGENFVDKKVCFKVDRTRAVSICNKTDSIVEKGGIRQFLVKEDSSLFSVNPNGGKVKVDNVEYTSIKQVRKKSGEKTSYSTPTKDSGSTVLEEYKVTFEGYSEPRTSKKIEEYSYQFTGWSISDSCSGELSDINGSGEYTHAKSGACEITANFSKKTSVSTSPIMCLSYNGSVQEGYKFNGWVDEDNNFFCGNGELKTPTRNMHLKPSFVNNSSTFAIDPNGGKVKFDNYYITSKTSKLKTEGSISKFENPTKESYLDTSFDSYYVTFSSTTKKSEAKRKLTRKFKFDKWEKIGICSGTLSFDGSTGAGEYKHADSGKCEIKASFKDVSGSPEVDPVTCPKIAVDSGYKLVGWYTGSSGTGTPRCGDITGQWSYTPQSSEVLYPYIVNNTSILEINPNTTSYTLDGSTYSSHKTISKTVSSSSSNYSTISLPTKGQTSSSSGSYEIKFTGYGTSSSVITTTYNYYNFSWASSGNCNGLSGTKFYYSSPGTCTLDAKYNYYTSTSNKKVNCPVITPPNDGYDYTIYGWYTTSNRSTGSHICNSGGEYTPNSSDVLYPIYEKNIPKEYTITYNANNGSGGPRSQTKTENVELQLTTSEPTRSNYTFVAWNTKSDGSGTTYYPGDYYNNNSNMTLYAQWINVGVYSTNGSVVNLTNQTLSASDWVYSSVFIDNTQYVSKVEMQIGSNSYKIIPLLNTTYDSRYGSYYGFSRYFDNNLTFYLSQNTTIYGKVTLKNNKTITKSIYVNLNAQKDPEYAVYMKKTGGYVTTNESDYISLSDYTSGSSYDGYVYFHISMNNGTTGSCTVSGADSSRIKEKTFKTFRHIVSAGTSYVNCTFSSSTGKSKEESYTVIVNSPHTHDFGGSKGYCNGESCDNYKTMTLETYHDKYNSSYHETEYWTCSSKHNHMTEESDYVYVRKCSKCGQLAPDINISEGYRHNGTTTVGGTIVNYAPWWCPGSSKQLA